MSTMLFRNALAALLALASASPSMAQFDVYQNLAFVPRQGQLNQVLTGIGARLAQMQVAGGGISVNQIAQAYRDTQTMVCAGNPDGEIVNWFAKIHKIEAQGGKVQVEMIVAERASVVAMLSADSLLIGQIEAAAGRWVRIDGKFISDSSCLLQVPPLTVASMLQPQYLATITSVQDSVTPAEVEQLELALPSEAWAPAARE